MIFSQWKDDDESKLIALNPIYFFLKIAKLFPAPIVVFDEQGLIKFMNRKAEELVGWSEKELLDKQCPFIPTSEKNLNWSFIKNIKQVKSIEKAKITVITKAGEPLLTTYSAIVVPSGDHVDSIVITFTEQREICSKKINYRDTLKELRDFKFALDQSSIVSVTDRKGIFTYVNQKFCEVSKYSREELLGKDYQVINSEFHRSEFFKKIWRTISSGHVWKGEIKNKDKNGNYFWVDTTIVPFTNEVGRPYQYVSIHTDITERKKALEEINFLVYNDELTSLPNKRKFIDKLRSHVETKRKYQNPIAVFCIDLDRFKILNDSMGHRFGDIFLKKVAERLKSCFSKHDFVARQSGDEFIVYLLNADEQKAKQVAQLIMKEINVPFFIEGHPYYSTCSIGISMYPIDGDKAEELVIKANIAMYRVKKNGKNNHQFYDAQMDQQVRREMELDKYLRKALQYEEFDLYYQPKLDLHTGEISGMEALLRWECPKMGMVSPNEFIPLAEETGLIIPIGEWVLRKACQQNKLWQEAGYPPMRVSVNLSVRQFQDPNLVLTVIKALEDANLDPKYLELEITENIAMDNKDFVNQKLETLRELGVHISIDDFGTGYSSLSYLGKYPINTLKIDKAFVDEIIHSKDTSVVRAIIALAHSFNLNVIAEGVEVQEQIDCLKKYACDEIQGYILSKPLKTEAFEEQILKKSMLLDDKDNGRILNY